MPSLSQILSDHSPLLLLDASSEVIQAAVLTRDGEPRWASRREESGTGLFACLDELGVEIGAMASFAFCEGPGSILGIRTSAMTVRVWNALRPQPTFGYFSLAVLAEGAPEGTTLIADARRHLWHQFKKGGSLGRVPATDLLPPIATPEMFRHWDPLPAGVKLLPYDLAAILRMPRAADADLFRPRPEPEAFLHQEPDYAKWTPQIHRAP
ncbi:MAG TPA: peptidase M22 [Opitutaceae bacterium]|jgi:tRNA threonylcarbamoyladenosine biosynthesis protein TsaB